MIFKRTFLCASAVVATTAAAAPPTPIDGIYQLQRRALANGTILRPPDVMGMYTMARGRFSLNLFFKNGDGSLASESTIGRYTFGPALYCEWIDFTTRNNIDHPGVTNDKPELKNHCAPVRRTGGRYVFVAPGENVTASYGPDGFTARIDNGDTDYWAKIAR